MRDPLGQRLVLVAAVFWLLLGVLGWLTLRTAREQPDRLGTVAPIAGGWLAASLAMTGWAIYRGRWTRYVARHGRSTEGRIESLGTSELRSGSVPFARYSFEAWGVTQRGKWYLPRDATGYEEGASVTVRYDSRRPRRSLLDIRQD